MSRVESQKHHNLTLFRERDKIDAIFYMRLGNFWSRVIASFHCSFYHVPEQAILLQTTR